MPTSLNSQQTDLRTVGDTNTPFAFTLKQDGAAFDATDYTVKWAMEDEDGDTKVAETSTGLTMTAAATGVGQIDFTSSDVDTEGVFYIWIVAIHNSTSKRETFPADGRKMAIRFYPRVPAS